MDLRPAGRSDRGALQNLCITEVRQHHRRTPLTSIEGWWELEAQRLVRGLRPPGQDVITGWVGSGLVAAAHLHRRTPDDLQVRVLAVARAHQGRGLGSQVLQATIATGFPLSAQAQVGSTASRRLLDKHGFVAVGEIDFVRSA